MLINFLEHGCEYSVAGDVELKKHKTLYNLIVSMSFKV